MSYPLLMILARRFNPILGFSASPLIFAGVMIFGTGQFMKKTYKAVLYFEGSVKGLSVGAPVVFRGVNVGRVSEGRFCKCAGRESIDSPLNGPSFFLSLEGIRPHRLPDHDQSRQIKI